MLLPTGKGEKFYSLLEILWWNSRICDVVLRLGPLHVFTAAFICHQSLLHMQWDSTCLAQRVFMERSQLLVTEESCETCTVNPSLQHMDEYLGAFTVHTPSQTGSLSQHSQPNLSLWNGTGYVHINSQLLSLLKINSRQN